MRPWIILGLWPALLSPAIAQVGAPPTAPSPAPQAAPAPQAVPPRPSPRVPPSSERFVFVPTNDDRSINWIGDLYPDCTSQGSIVYRVETKPEHGELSFAPGDSFASYPMNSPLQHCNEKKVPGLFTHYVSAPGFTGEDHADVLYLLPNATALVVKYTILVR